ncbi:alpha/beta hydrolase, partial [Streptomyces sp. 24-1644]
MRSVSEGPFPSSSVRLITRAPLRTTLRTDDGTRIEAVYEPCTAGAAAAAGGVAAGTAIVVAHGFTGAADRPA